MVNKEQKTNQNENKNSPNQINKKVKREYKITKLIINKVKIDFKDVGNLFCVRWDAGEKLENINA